MPSDPETEALRQRLDALVKDADTAEAKATAAHRRVQAARLLLEEEQAADLERKATATKGVLPSPSSSSTTSDMVDGAAYDLALVTNLHVQVTVVPSVHQLMNIVLDTTSPTTPSGVTYGLDMVLPRQPRPLRRRLHR
jgi:hypothetical protein